MMRGPCRNLVLAAGVALSAYEIKAQPAAVPKVWDETALSGWHVPLAEPGHDPVPLQPISFTVFPS